MNEKMDIGKRAEQMVLEHCAVINREISENIFNSIINHEVMNNMKAETFEGKEYGEHDDTLKVRFHRGGLKESMETLFEPKDWNDFLEHVKQEDENILVRSIKCDLYDEDPDTRIGWECTWIITARYKGESYEYPIAFSNKNVMWLK
jgi:hypothetical protein